jgi:hypothetical protein
MSGYPQQQGYADPFADRPARAPDQPRAHFADPGATRQGSYPMDQVGGGLQAPPRMPAASYSQSSINDLGDAHDDHAAVYGDDEEEHKPLREGQEFSGGFYPPGG